MTEYSTPKSAAIAGINKTMTKQDSDLSITAHSPKNASLQANTATDKADLRIRLASPRGFCAGVSRAIEAVEDALAQHGAPVYVRHEIVHNAHVVDRLRAMGAVFVDDLTDAPNDRPIVLSAHGAPKSVYKEVTNRGLAMVDATCPLVLKVHNEARRQAADGRHIILIGHAHHPEVIGTLGQAPEGSVSLIETVEDARSKNLPSGPYAYVTQTTLSVDDTADIVAALTERFPDIVGPRTADICYATSNRQAAVKAIANGCDAVLVIGDPTSSNSNRLVETALSAGAKSATLVNDPKEFDLQNLENAQVIGVTAGASAPEELVETLLERFAASRSIAIDHVCVAEEDVVFKAPTRPASSPHS
ncbi:MAG: 4-hydroxy-3-methylbut-2-enyl diphosphate reductase [Pseudomonadota bacterium]